MAYSDEVLADSPIFYLPLDESTTGATAADASGNDRYFSVVDATANAPSVMPTGAASYDFNGTTARLSRPTNTALSPAALTIEAWIKPDRVTGTQMGIASKDTYPGGWALYVKNSKLMAWWRSTDSFGSTTLVAGQAYHVAMTYSGGTAKLYVNGVLDGTFTGRTYEVNTTDMLVGCTTAGNGGAYRGLFFDGLIDEVAFYPTALSDARIAAHYDAGNAPPAPEGTLSGTAPSVTGSFAGSAEVLPIDAALAGTAPPVAASFDAVTTVPAIGATLSGTAPSVTGSFAGGIPDAVTGTLAGQAPAVFGTFAASYAAAPPEPVPTDTTYANDGYGYDGTADVEFEPPIEEPPHPRLRKIVKRVHQSMPPPNLVNGRPT